MTPDSKREEVLEYLEAAKLRVGERIAEIREEQVGPGLASGESVIRLGSLQAVEWEIDGAIRLIEEHGL